MSNRDFVIDKKFRSEKEKDAELVELIKPKLKKFAIDLQIKNAEKVTKEKRAVDKIILSNDYVQKEMSRLAFIAFFELRLWVESPPVLEMAWLKEGSSKPEHQAEMNLDLAGFATFLLREYYGNFQTLKYKDYPNPIQQENLSFFWDKMNVDLKLLIKADLLSQKKGNQGAVVLHKDEIQ